MPTVDTLCINDPTTTHQMIMLFGETFVTVAYLIILHILYCSTLIAKIRLLVDLCVYGNLVPLFIIHPLVVYFPNPVIFSSFLLSSNFSGLTILHYFVVALTQICIPDKIDIHQISKRWRRMHKR